MVKLILASLALFLPFQLRLPQVPVVNNVNIYLIILTFLFLFARDPKAERTKFDTPLLIFIILWIGSFIHSLFYPWGIWKTEVVILFKRLITLVMIYYAVARTVKTKEQVNFIFLAILLSLVITALHVWRQGMLAGPNFADFKRSSGPFGISFEGADIAGGFIAIFTPFLLAFFLFTRNKFHKLSALFGIGICFMGMFATYSRGALLALVVGLCVTLLASFREILKTSVITAGIILFMFAGFAAGWQYWVPESTVTRVSGTVQEDLLMGSKLDESSESRFEIWQAGIDLAKTSPVFGVGFKIPEFLFKRDTHNAFIQIAAEMGFVVFFIFVWFLWTIFVEAKRMIPTEFKMIGIGFIGCLASFLLVNMFYSNFFRDTVVGTFWLLLGLLAAAKKFVQVESRA